MIWPDGCITASTVLQDYYYGYVLERCIEFDTPWMCEKVLLMTDSPRWALDISKFFMSKKWLGLKKLIDIIIEDLALLRGTHAAKNRFIARLRKLVNLLEDTYVEGTYTGFINVGDMLGLTDIKEYIEVLNAFRSDYHRVRDKAHELVYPHLKSELERIKHVVLWFSRPQWYRCGLRFEFGDLITRAELVLLKGVKRYRKLNMNEAVDVLKRIISREERRTKRDNLPLLPLDLRVMNPAASPTTTTRGSWCEG